MSDNQVDFQLPADDKQAIMDAAALIQSKLTQMVSLSPEERIGGLQLGTKSFGHIEKISDYMDQNPHLIPSYVDVAAFKRDVQVVRDLREINRVLEPLVQSISDTAMVAGIEAMTTGMAFYNAVKVASKNNAPNANVVYADLKERFVRKGRTTNTTTPPKGE
jgi:hypothetical protein